MRLIHATGIYVDGRGVLLRGPSGSGKSDLALRMMARGAELIGDDYIRLSGAENGSLLMAAAENIAGRIEIRNVGILAVPNRPEAPLDLVLDLQPAGEIRHLERLPEGKTVTLEGVDIPGLDFYAFEASAPEKLRAALKILSRKD